MKIIVFAVLFLIACSVSKKHKQVVRPSITKDVMSTGDTLYSNGWDSMYFIRKGGDTSFVILPEDIEKAKQPHHK